MSESVLAPALSGKDGAVRLALRVQPGARRSAIIGMHGERLRVAVRAPPVDGRANAEVIKLIAGLLGLPGRAIVLRAGLSSRDKALQIEAQRGEVERILGAALAARPG